MAGGGSDDETIFDYSPNQRGDSKSDVPRSDDHIKFSNMAVCQKKKQKCH